MPLPEVEIHGPERATLEDIEAINRLFAESFTDRYHRDGMTGVRVPFLSREIWRYAIEDAGEGAMLWRDAAGQLAAFNMVHLSGAEGWMGPLAVRPALQGAGVGSRIVRAGIGWLRRKGARIVGLETMPRTVENIGFYSRLGFAPGYLTVTLTRELDASGEARPAGRLLSQVASGRDALIAGCAGLTDRLASGVDFTRELLLTGELGLGDTVVLEGTDGQPIGFALWHTAPLAMGRSSDELRVLKVVARDLPAFRAVIRAIEAQALARDGIHRVGLRCQTAFGDAYALLLDDGYRVHWTDLRMTLPGAGEQVAPPGVVISNWEI